MRITNFSSPRIMPSFGKRMQTENKTTKPEPQSKPMNVAKSALLTGAAGVLCFLPSCNSGRVFLDVTDDGYAVITDEYGDCLDTVPRRYKKYEELANEIDANRDKSIEAYNNIGKEPLEPTEELDYEDLDDETDED